MKTKIVATIGPASSSEAKLITLAKAGVTTFRLNTAHGTPHTHGQVVRRVRKIAAQLDLPLELLLDLAGPKIRSGKLKTPIDLVPGDALCFVAGAKGPLKDGRVGCSFEGLADVVAVGDPLFVDDGLIELKVVGVDPELEEVRCEVVHGGVLKDRKGINLPDTDLGISALTKADRRYLVWGLRKVDIVAVSFVRHEDDLSEARRLMTRIARCHGAQRIPLLVAKIETPQAVQRYAQILEEVDGILVARGDLGVETNLFALPVLQRRLIAEALDAGRFAITATQMMESMRFNPRPTRAEVTDVATAVWNGSTHVMTSAETATGDFPVKTIEAMTEVIRVAEANPVVQLANVAPLETLLAG